MNDLKVMGWFILEEEKKNEENMEKNFEFIFWWIIESFQEKNFYLNKKISIKDF